jgi:hypothetical protein
MKIFIYYNPCWGNDYHHLYFNKIGNKKESLPKNPYPHLNQTNINIYVGDAGHDFHYVFDFGNELITVYETL